MPYGDGTGPMGLGPMTGRGAGYCAGFARPGWMGRGFFGGGRGGRFLRRGAFGMPGWLRFGWTEPDELSSISEKEALEGQVNVLKTQLNVITQRLSELEQKSAPE